jgi:hypothetical protein
MMEYWFRAWSERISIEDLKSCEYGKMLLRFISWRVKYLLNFRLSSRRLQVTASMPPIAFREILAPLNKISFEIGHIPYLALGIGIGAEVYIFNGVKRLL